jgi:hypothetical protein
MFFIVWGSRGRWSVKKDHGGQFFCPNCGGDRAWVLAVLKRWFTLFWIPLFPMGKPVGQAVQCATCATRFQEGVLQQATTTEMATELQGSMRLGVTAVVRAQGGVVHPAAVEAIQRTGFADYDAAALQHDIEGLDLADFGQHLSYLSGALSLPGKEQFLGSLVQVATADGDVGAARPTIDQIGAGLGLTPAHVAGILVTPMAAFAEPSAPPPPPPPPEGDVPTA